MWINIKEIFCSGIIGLMIVLMFCSSTFATDVDIANKSGRDNFSNQNDTMTSSSVVTTTRASPDIENKSNSNAEERTHQLMPFLPKGETDKEMLTTISDGTTTTTTKTSTAKETVATTFDTESDTTTVTEIPTTTIHQFRTDAPTTTTDISHVTTSGLKQSTSLSTTKGTLTNNTIVSTETQDKQSTTTTAISAVIAETTNTKTSKQTTKVPTTIKSTHKSVTMTTNKSIKSTSKPTTRNKNDNKTVLSTESSKTVTERIYINSSIDNSNSTEDPMRIIVIYSEDDFMSRDSFWPIALALTIGIPAIIVMAVTITVLYRRRIANPRNRLSMYAGHDYSTM